MAAMCAGASGLATAQEAAASQGQSGHQGDAGPAMAALDEAAWAFAAWAGAVRASAEAYGLPEPDLVTRYRPFEGPVGTRNLIAHAEPGRAVLRLDGSGWRRETPAAARRLTRNAAHEAAHLYQYAAGTAETEPRWLHEGFADAMARAQRQASGDRQPWGARARCAEVMAAGPIDDAQAAGVAGALYDCSSLAVAAVAEARGEGARAFYDAFAAAGGTEKAFFALAGEAGRARSVRAFLTGDFRQASAPAIIEAMRAGRL